eukprot:Em0368g4a
MPCPLKDRARRSCWRTRYKRPRRVVTPTPPPGAMKCSHDVQTTTSAAPTKKRSSKSRENVRGAKGTIRLTQVGIEEVKNVAQCSLVTSTGKVVTLKFSLDYDKPSELCRHLTKHGYLQSNEEEEFLQQVADVLQKTKLEKKKPSPKLQAQEPPVTKPALKEDESTATSPHVTLDDPISHAPKERFISQTSIDSVISEDAHPVTMLDMSLHSGLQGFQPMQPPVLPHPGVGMSSLYAPPPPQPSMYASLTSSTFQNMGAMGNVSSSIGLGTIPPSNAGLGTLLSSNGGLGTLPPNAGLGTLLLSGIGLGTLLPNAGLGTLPPNAGLGTLPPSNIGLVTQLPSNGGLGTLPASSHLLMLAWGPYYLPLPILVWAYHLLLPAWVLCKWDSCRHRLLAWASFHLMVAWAPYSLMVVWAPYLLMVAWAPCLPLQASFLPNLGLPLQPPPLSQLPHIVSYPNLSNMASSSSGQPEQTKKFEISEVSEGSPVTLVSFGETTVVMDSCVEGEEDMEEEDTLESSDSNMYDFTQPPLTPAAHSGAQPPPLHHHHHHHLNGAVVSDDSGHAHSMILPAKIGRSKRTRLRSHRPVSAHVASAFTAPPPLSPLVDCSPMEMPVPEPHPQAGGFLPTESQALFNEAFGQFLNHFGKRADTVGEVSSLSTSSELTSRLPSSQPVALCTSDEHGEEDDQDDSDEEEGDNSEKDGDQEYVKLITKFNVKKQQLEERRRQALEEYMKNKDAKRRLVTNTLHHSLRQGAEVNSSSDRLFHSTPGGGRETTPQYMPTRPAKKSSLEKKNTAKTYAEVTTTNVEKEANAGGGGAGGGKERVMRAGSVGNNLAGPTSAMGGTQSKFQHIPTVVSEWTEFTGVTPKGSQIVGSTSVANGGSPVAGSSTGGGGGGYSSVSGTSANSTTRVDITEFDPIHKS